MESAEWSAWHLALSVSVITIIAAAMILLPLVGQHIDWLKATFTFDKFTIATLNAKVLGIIDYTPAVWLIAILTATLLLWKKMQKEYALLTLFGGMGLFVTIALIFFIGKIERYSQHAAVEFGKYEGQQVDIKTMGFKSYLHFCAGNQRPIQPILPDNGPPIISLRWMARRNLQSMRSWKSSTRKTGSLS